jgi:hypothetical protein
MAAKFGEIVVVATAEIFPIRAAAMFKNGNVRVLGRGVENVTLLFMAFEDDTCRIVVMVLEFS